MIKGKFLKTLSVLVAVIAVGGVFAANGKSTAPLVLDAGAVYETYEMTKEYKSGRYYKNLTRV